MKILINLTQIAMVILCSAPIAHAKKLLVDIDLKWKPTSDYTEFKKLEYNDISTLKIELKDARTIQPSARIGQNTEEEKDFLPVDTKSHIADFINKGILETFQNIGIKAVETGGDYVLTGEVKDFFVAETNTYKGLFKAQVALKKGGKTVWEGTLAGDNSRFGRSYSYDNYMESLSDSVIDACHKLLENDGFRKAFQTKKGKN